MSLTVDTIANHPNWSALTPVAKDLVLSAMIRGDKIVPTFQQASFIDVLLNGTGHIALVARAGCGKTSTIIMGVLQFIARFQSAELLVCAFNKAIADEVGAKLKALGVDWKKCQASTLHALGWGLVKFFYRINPNDKTAINKHKVADLVDASNQPVAREYRQQIIDLVRMAKQAGVGFFDDLPIASVKVWHDLASHFDINGLDETTDGERVVACAQEIYRQSLGKTDCFDYDDMILFPLIKNLRVKFGKDVIFLDEAQDLSRARQALARKFLKPNTGRMIIVGDDRQAIYGFSGADAAALDNLTKQLGATVMPLSVTWRCPKAVVREANRFVADIEAADAAPEGEVLHQDDVPEQLVPGEDAVLCRNTAPLIELAYKLIRKGVPAKVEGRAIGEGLKALATRWKLTTIEALLKKLEEYCAREQQKAMAKGDEEKAEAVADKVATLVEICKACTAAKKYSVKDVEAFIDNLFADGDTKSVILATYHRSKGREWNRVVLFQHSSRCPSKMAKQEWQKAQEANLAYVAITRAKQTLVYAG